MQYTYTLYFKCVDGTVSSISIRNAEKEATLSDIRREAGNMLTNKVLANSQGSLFDTFERAELTTVAPVV